MRKNDLTGRSTTEEKPRRERRGLTKKRRAKSPLGIKLSIEESSNLHVEDLGAETRVREREIRREN
jgi:hypothetical protein